MPAQNLLGFVGSSLLELGPWRPIHWWLIATVMGAAGWVSFSGQHRSQWADRHAAWLVWHWVTGGPLEPRRAVTDGSRVRRAAVAAARTAVPVALIAGEYVRSGAPHGTGVDNVAVSAVAGTVLLAAATLLIVSLAVSTAHYFQWVRPLHRAIHQMCGWGDDKRPGSYLTVRRGLVDGRPPWPVRRARELLHLRPLPDGVVVRMAPEFDCRPTRVDNVINTTKAKLDMGDVSATPVLRGRHQSIQFRPRVPMPELVRYSDPAIQDLIARCKPSEVLFGLGRGARPVVFDIDSETPHMLLSASTGAGKSWTLHNAAAQLMAKGAEVRVLDYKRHSHKWVRHIDGIRYAKDIPEIAQHLIDADDEAKRRNRLHDDIDLDDPQPQYQRLVIICDELNATADQLKAWWAETRTSKDPTRCPAITAMRSLLFMGRMVKVHLLFASQQGRADSIGGGDARENCGLRILAGDYSKNTWNMLAPQLDYVPGRAEKGWAMVCHGSRAVETRLLAMTPHEARALVVESQGYRVRPTGDVRVPAGSVPLGDRAGHVRVAGHLNGGIEPVTLWKASSDKGDNIVALKYWALSKAAQRDREKGVFPAPVVDDPSRPLYDPRDLQRWELLRTAGGVDRLSVIDVDEVNTTGDEDEVGTEGTERMEARRA